MRDKCPEFWRSLAAAAAATAAGFAPATFAAPAALSDAALDTVTAGTTAQPAEGKPPVVIVADGARYTFVGEQRVHLSGDAQEQARALNVVGAAGSDVGNAVNVLTLNTQAVGGASQQNSLQQRETAAGSLGRATLKGANVTTTAHLERSVSTSNSSSLVTGRRLLARTRTSSTEQFAAFVPAHNPLQDLTLTVATPELPPVQIPAIHLDLLNDDALFGIEGSAGPFTIGAPQLVLGSVSLDGDDVVLSSGYVQLPTIELGTATMKVCFSTCRQDSVDLGHFDGRRVDLPGGDLRFEGANIFKDTQINAGGGIALVGAGTINVIPGHITLSGELTLDLADPQISFDFEIPSILQINGTDIIGPWTIDGPDVAIEIPPISVSHTLIDEDVGPSYSASFDGVLCLALYTTDCGTASRDTERQETRIDVVVYEVSASSHSSGGSSIAEESSTHAGATLADAEADLIAMSQASAMIDATNSITLEDGAQRGLRAVNAVNAADAIIGNALNVTALQPDRLKSGSLTGVLNQSNVFSQYRTGYGL
jgi:hypothetical protein